MRTSLNSFSLVALAICLSLNASASGCDRTCLANALDHYLGAMLQHDPRRAPLAADVRSTENAAAVRPGDGLWKSVTALGKSGRRYYDSAAGQAVYFGPVEESSVTNLAMIRILVAGGRIVESELVVARKSDVIFDAAGFALEPPPQTRRPGAVPQSREAMLAAAGSYFDGLENHNGAAVRAVKGCPRIENGVLTAGTPAVARPPVPGIVVLGDCTTLEGFGKTIAGVAHRRYVVVDEDAGVVLGLAVFNRPPGARRDDGSPYPRNLLSELFVIDGGRITSIYAIMHYMQPDVANAPGW